MSRNTTGHVIWNCRAPVSFLMSKFGSAGLKYWSTLKVHVPSGFGAASDLNVAEHHRPRHLELPRAGQLPDVEVRVRRVEILVDAEGPRAERVRRRILVRLVVAVGAAHLVVVVAHAD